jgi:hypothetical protein
MVWYYVDAIMAWDVTMILNKVSVRMMALQARRP